MSEETTIRVIAMKGAQCPMEGQPRQYITDAEPREVPSTAYYRRLIADGSLEVAAASVAKKPAKDPAPGPRNRS